MISFVICSVDEQRFANVTASIRAAMGDSPAEIIRITDARSMAEGYMRGFEQCTGEFIVFCHDDILILNTNLGDRIVAHLSKYDVIGVAGTNLLIESVWLAAGPPFLFGQIAHPRENLISIDIFNTYQRIFPNMQAIDGVFIAVRRDALAKVSFDSKTFDGFHLYDLDFSYAAFKAGLSVAVACDVNIYHASAGNYDANWQIYSARFRDKWFAHIPPMATRRFNWSFAIADSKAHALKLMNPEYWSAEENPTDSLKSSVHQ